MSTRSPDALELLLPDATPGVWQRAQRVTTFLRLLSNDSRCVAPSRVHVSLERARAEYERQLRARGIAAVEELLRHHLEAVAGCESFLWLGEARGSSQEAWSSLEEFREELEGLARVTEPGEGPLEVARRLLESLERLAGDEGLLALWRARWTRCAEGPAAGEKLLRELASRADARFAPQRACALAGVVECLLDRGSVRAARAFLEEHAARALGDARLRRLLVWVRLLQGDAAGARALNAGLAPWRGTLPSALVELRADVPEWLPLLSGKAAQERAWRPSETSRADCASLRAELGAALVGVFALHAGGEAEPVSVEAAPGLRARIPGWLEDRDGACTLASEPEHRLVVSARAVVLHRCDPAATAAGSGSEVPAHAVASPLETALRGALDPASIRALVLQPVLDERGEVAGWLRVECEHHLLPSRSKLARLARAWAPAVLEHRRAAAGGTQPAAKPARARSKSDPEALDEQSPQAQVFRELVEQLGIKTAQRSWWGFDVLDGAPRLVAQGGQAPADALEQPGAGKGLERALLSGGCVHFSEPDPGLALHAPSASGLVLPLRSRERLTGLWAVESSRRRDFAHGDPGRLSQIAAGFGSRLRAAQFRAWHRARFGFDVHVQDQDPEERGAGDLVAAGRSRSSVVLSGPPGCGKQVLARWLHFEGERRDGELLVLDCSSESAESLERALASESATILLDELPRASASLQMRLLRRLDEELALQSAPPAGGFGGGSAEPVQAARRVPRILITSSQPLAQASAEGRIRADLVQRLQRLELSVLPLERRRGEIPALVELMRQRFAREENLRPPCIEDDALALLWRQSWEGNLRQLENLVYKLVLLHPGQRVGAPQVEAVAKRFQLELVRRLSSRHPDPQTICAALRTTCNQRGSFNKTRAALYLGWDPDTLVSRMEELGLPASHDGPWPPAAPERAGGAPDSVAVLGLAVGVEPPKNGRDARP